MRQSHGYFLQNLPNLKILDLDGNPVSSSIENYRLYIIYHLRTLKALDGSPIVSRNSWRFPLLFQLHRISIVILIFKEFFVIENAW